MKLSQLTVAQRRDVKRLTSPRPFEPDPVKHDALIKEAQAALTRLHRAGISLDKLEDNS